MIVVVHEVYESCSDTDIFAIDTSKVQDQQIRQRLEFHNPNDWYEPQDFDVFQREISPARMTSAKFPQMVQKFFTLYYGG